MSYEKVPQSYPPQGKSSSSPFSSQSFFFRGNSSQSFTSWNIEPSHSGRYPPPGAQYPPPQGPYYPPQQQPPPGYQGYFNDGQHPYGYPPPHGGHHHHGHHHHHDDHHHHHHHHEEDDCCLGFLKGW
nr:unnamed protein product [Digitaria exilis]